MSRFGLRENLKIDLQIGYIACLDSDLLVFFPGESQTESFLKKSNHLEPSNGYISCYTQPLSKCRLVISDPSRTKDADLLTEALNSLKSHFKLSQKELNIGIGHFPPDSYGDLLSSLNNLLNYFCREDSGFQQISIFTTAGLEKPLKDFISNYCGNRKQIFFISNKLKYDIYDKIMCKYCKELPYEPYFSSCCGCIYCERCKILMKNCMDCGKACEMIYESFLNSFFCKLSYKCKCNAMVSFENIKEHLYGCKTTLFQCKIEKCPFEGTQGEMVVHAIYKHSEDLFDKSKILMPDIGETVPRECPECFEFTRNENQCTNCGYIYNSFEEILSKFGLAPIVN